MTVATRFTNKTLWKGLMRGGVWGLGLNALGTFVQDLWNNPCRAPREFALNMATSISYGLVSAVGASIIGALLFTAGAPMAVVTVGTYLAGVGISLGLEYAQKHYDLPDYERRWRQQNRQSLSPDQLRCAMNQDKPAIEHPEVGDPFWLDAPQIDLSFVVLAGIAALCFNGAWFWVWNIGTSRRAAVVIGTAIGVLISLVWCGIRMQRFDLRTWQWRNATYRQPYGRTVGLIIGLASGAGALTARYIAQITGQDVQLGLMAGIFNCFGIFGIWSMIEGTWYLWHYRHHKRVKRQ